MGSKMVLFFTVNSMIGEWMGGTPLWNFLPDCHIYDLCIFHVIQIGEAVCEAEFLVLLFGVAIGIGVAPANALRLPR
jgi:hypothetical protein